MAFVPVLDLTNSKTIALHELDPLFRKVTLENEKLKALVRDLRFHKDPVGKYSNRFRIIFLC